MHYKPINIARQLNISTSALRHYESWGIVPAPERAENGYRLYGEEHLAYFKCIRAMYPAFTMKVISEVLIHIQQGEADEAFWLVSREQASLYHEKIVLDQTMKLLEDPDLNEFDKKAIRDGMTIGEVSKITNVPTSAIRHWEREDLIHPLRNNENGYRVFSRIHIRQILLIRSLRSTVFYLENMQDAVRAIENKSVHQAKKAMKEALASIHSLNKAQYRGVSELYNLCKLLKLVSSEV